MNEFPVCSVQTWMDEHRLGAGPIEDIEPIGGGTQNRVIRFRREREEFVLRAGPPNPRPKSDEAMRREARILRSLGPTFVPVPDLLAAEDDPGPIGGAFYLMRPVHGSLFTASLADFDANPAAKRRVGLAMVEALVELGRVDHIAVGLEDFGRPDGYLARQVDRWRTQLAGYTDTSGYPGPGRNLGPLEDWLAANLPATGRTAILHGDFHINNVLLRDDGEVAAIVDWELATIGDPLVDLGQLLATWPTDDDSSLGLVPAERAAGLATREELVAHYQARSGADLGQLPWYQAMAGYRLGVILEGTHARAIAGAAPREIGELLHVGALRLWDAATELTTGVGARA